MAWVTEACLDMLLRGVSGVKGLCGDWELEASTYNMQKNIALGNALQQAVIESTRDTSQSLM